jgi:hypothetical protein
MAESPRSRTRCTHRLLTEQLNTPAGNCRGFFRGFAWEARGGVTQRGYRPKIIVSWLTEPSGRLPVQLSPTAWVIRGPHSAEP